jgi:hypothetical protein
MSNNQHTINIPQPFTGTAEEAAANYATHDFYSYDESSGDRCTGCDCRPWGVWANWPCGTTEEEIGRIDVPDDVADAIYAGTPLAQIGERP